MKRYYQYYVNSRKPRQPKKFRETELSSIADVSFLLLIFFIVTSSFVINEGLLFELPSKNPGARKVNKEDTVDVYPLEDGYRMNDIILNRDELGKLLMEKKKEIQHLVVIIHVAGNLQYKRVVDIISLLKENSITRISLKNE